jgi:superfamily I DNA/RNA helicase
MEEVENGATKEAVAIIGESPSSAYSNLETIKIKVIKMIYTQQQERIFDAIKNTGSHIIINAGAGTGKTTTIVEAVNLIEEQAAFLAFNSKIAKALDEKLPDNVHAKTFHSFGFAAIRNAGIRTKVNNRKVHYICQELLGKDCYTNPIVKLVSRVKGALVEGTDVKAIHGLINKFNISFQSDREEQQAVEAIPAILTLCRTQTHHIDFDDMIWLPLVNNYPKPHYGVVFVDEAQDFDKAQRTLILEVVQDGRCIIVGDKNQAIYGFRGADSNSIARFAETLREGEREVVELPLTVSWRCPKSVVKEANRFVADFSCPENAPQGSVIFDSPFLPQPQDMVLCRYNAPLVSAFYDLISRGKSAYINGKDMTKGLITSVKKITRNNNMGVEEFASLFNADYEFNMGRLLKDGKTNQAMALEDKKDCLMIFVQKATTVGGIIEEIKRVFSGNDEGEIMLSTVHKAKGLEANTVYILATERMPHKYGGVEENNIAYVAITRAKRNLYLVGPQIKKV